MKVGVIGGGQLARMMLPPAIELGIELRVLAEGVDESATVGAFTSVGDYRDAAAVLDFASFVDVVTFDHEHVPQDVLAALVDAGVAVRPGPAALAVAQDKLLMRERLAELGMPLPDWARLESAGDLESFLSAHDGVAIVKTPRGGYDGKGVRVVRKVADVADWFESGAPLLAEQLVDFRRELAQSVARRPSGQLATWPVVASVQKDGVCAEVIAPAPASTDRVVTEAAEIASEVATSLDVTGVLAVELFETLDGRLLINELAMRPHNTGHWSIDGCTTSQFEQHLRAVLDLPLGSTEPLAEWSVMVNVFGGPVSARYPQAMAQHPAVKFHDYGKAPRSGRKVGHVTAIGDDLDEVAYRARAAAELIGSN